MKRLHTKLFDWLVADALAAEAAREAAQHAKEEAKQVAIRNHRAANNLVSLFDTQPEPLIEPLIGPQVEPLIGPQVEPLAGPRVEPVAEPRVEALVQPLPTPPPQPQLGQVHSRPLESSDQVMAGPQVVHSQPLPHRPWWRWSHVPDSQPDQDTAPDLGPHRDPEDFDLQDLDFDPQDEPDDYDDLLKAVLKQLEEDQHQPDATQSAWVKPPRHRRIYIGPEQDPLRPFLLPPSYCPPNQRAYWEYNRLPAEYEHLYNGLDPTLVDPIHLPKPVDPHAGEKELVVLIIAQWLFCDYMNAMMGPHPLCWSLLCFTLTFVAIELYLGKHPLKKVVENLAGSWVMVFSVEWLAGVFTPAEQELMITDLIWLLANICAFIYVTSKVIALLLLNLAKLLEPLLLLIFTILAWPFVYAAVELFILCIGLAIDLTELFSFVSGIPMAEIMAFVEAVEEAYRLAGLEPAQQLPPEQRPGPASLWAVIMPVINFIQLILGLFR